MTQLPPTTVFSGGPVFTADPARSWATAVAVRGGQVVAVGGDAEVAAWRSRADEVVDLGGRLLLPGFVDAHAHPVQGGLERSRCDLSPVEDAAAYSQLVASYVTAHPDRTWVLGGGWSMGAYADGRPTREQLDAVTGDRLAYLPNRDHHSAWVNTRALQLAGVDQSTPDPSDGRIERDAGGHPTGLLHEGAMDLVARLVPEDTQDELDEGLRVAQTHLHSLGVVGWQDAMVRVHEAGPNFHASYARAQTEGWLSARVSGALWWDRACPPSGIPAQVADLVRRRSEAREAGDRYTLEHVKVMADGVVETFTAALLEPYLDACGHATANTGLSFLDRETVQEVTIALDAAGFGVHFHALGDRAIRDALDAIDAARLANGSADHRHQLAHLQVVDPADVPRFRRCGATANIQALWACHEPQMDVLSIPFLGPERAARQYPFGDLLRAGATLAMGSDWPVSSADPLHGIHVAVNRVHHEAPPGTPPLSPEQTLPLSVALAAYTAGSAHASRLDSSGSVRIGAQADLVVLDGDPFEGSIDRIGHTRVDRTYIGGQLVHQAD